MENKGIRKRRQLKWSMVAMLTICWFLPLLSLSAAVFFFVNAKIGNQLENTIVTSTDKAVEICQMRINAVIEASKTSSYIPAIRNSYERYQADGNNSQLSQEVSLFLAQQYKYDKDINMTALYFTEEPESIIYCYNNNNQGGNYDTVKAFNENARELLQKKAEEIDTSTAFVNVAGRIYLIRNIVDGNFHPYAVIIMELNMESIFEGLDSIWGFENGDVFIDGQSMLQLYEEDPYKDMFRERFMKRSYYRHDQENSFVYKKEESNRHRFAYLVNLDSTAIVSEMETIRYVFYLLVAFMIPLIIIVFLFFHKRVNMPIKELWDVYKEIEKGNYGCQVDLGKSDKEFYDLGEAFNSMSNELKFQFEKIYLEELALKDANIMALQSQINPHFLNNTLEIINWEARMNGNYKVSSMIEALSTMLDATMNRKREQLIPLSEELSYVKAYLYIIAQRFGDNFSVEKEIDESLMSVKVPRLIIQPIIENAVEHGMNISRRGKIKIIIRREDDKLLIEIMDNGRLTEEDKKKIDKLLNTDSTSGPGSLSLGIRNVNKRLQIIYGSDCGLTIKSDKNHFTVSTIMVKIDKIEEQ